MLTGQMRLDLTFATVHDTLIYPDVLWADSTLYICSIHKDC